MLANKDHSHPAIKGDRAQMNMLWMNILLVNTLCGPILSTHRWRAGLLHGTCVNPTAS